MAIAIHRPGVVALDALSFSGQQLESSYDSPKALPLSVSNQIRHELFGKLKAGHIVKGDIADRANILHDRHYGGQSSGHIRPGWSRWPQGAEMPQAHLTHRTPPPPKFELSSCWRKSAPPALVRTRPTQALTPQILSCPALLSQVVARETTPWQANTRAAGPMINGSHFA
jgi:hypothetical protein